MSDEHCRGACDVDAIEKFCFGCHRTLEQRIDGEPSPLDFNDIHPAFETDLNDDLDDLDDIGCSDISI